jgi:DNA-directed RNA polymerase subunit beta'
MQTTLGQLLINEALPEDMRDTSRVLDKAGLKTLMREIAEKHPEQYSAISHQLLNVGQSAATTGNFSFSLRDFQAPPSKKVAVHALRIKANAIIDHPTMSSEERKKKLTLLLGDALPGIMAQTLDDAHKAGSRLAAVIKSGSKGTPVQFNTTVGAPLLYLDHKDDPVPIPVFNSISEGLDPAEYWASAYGTRKGLLSTKLSTSEAGYFGKKLGLAANRLVVTEHDCGTQNGTIMPGEDRENIGTILVKPVGELKAGTVIKPEHLAQLRGKQVLVRSPITCEAAHGLCARCAGVRETGTLPELGDNLGLSASSALGERLSQIMLSAKHSSGAAAAKKSYTYEDIERLFEMPKSSVEFAPVAEHDGVVKGINKAPAGGVYVKVDDEEYWAPSEESVTVKPGQHIEAGEILTNGMPNPTLLARHRGIGDARKIFVNQVREVTGNTVSRRNAEILSRAMIAHVNVTTPYGPNGTLVGDVPRYDDFVRGYEPRGGSQDLLPTQATGRYLEKPVLHYTIGTKITNRVTKDLQANGIKNILTHRDPPGFEPDVQRMFAHSQLDPDWMTRMSGYHLTSSLPDAVHRGMSSSEHSTSFVPALAKGVDFGINTKETGEY